jgi:hypothetical protein
VRHETGRSCPASTPAIYNPKEANMKIRTMLIYAIALILSLSTVSVALASFKYSYTGNSYTWEDGSGVFSTSNKVTIDFVSTVLVYGSTSDLLNTTSWISALSMSDGHQTINLNTAFLSYSYLKIINAPGIEGIPDMWDIFLATPQYSYYIGSVNTAFNHADTSYQADPYAMGQSLSPGQWTVTENTPVPEPSSYALFCIGLGVLGYARKKMMKHEE